MSTDEERNLTDNPTHITVNGKTYLIADLVNRVTKSYIVQLKKIKMTSGKKQPVPERAMHYYKLYHKDIKEITDMFPHRTPTYCHSVRNNALLVIKRNPELEEWLIANVPNCTLTRPTRKKR